MTTQSLTLGQSEKLMGTRYGILQMLYDVTKRTVPTDTSLKVGD